MSALRPEALLTRLADGDLHSGEDLARRLGVTRAAVWKHIAKLEDWGLDVDAVPGVGYRLARPVDLLDQASLRSRLEQLRAAEVAGYELGSLEVFTELESTNRYLHDRPPPAHGALDCCLAEYQTAGRGRRGRRWTAPLGSGLCVSAAWQFEAAPPDLPALTLATGVVVRRVLHTLAGLEIALKWPNDLLWDERKLGGILIEMTAEAQGGCHVVIGLGINVAMPVALLATVSDWARGAADLTIATNGAPPRRGELAARLIHALGELCAAYAISGFAPYRAAFRAADYLRGRPITLDGANGSTVATALGIDAGGALLVETTSGARERVISGDVSVRTVP
jgi:BirA family biotin operon repressor/biotin-[acetyl-CoA-carboxylase] ligase